MPASQQHVHPDTPMGASLVEGGATFRVWAPEAREVYVITNDLGLSRLPGWAPRERDLMAKQDDETWTAFVPGIEDGSPYRFWVVGEGSSGFKRDPCARELGIDPSFPNCDCLVRDPRTYPWHDQGWRTPPFRDFIIYQLHVGAFYAVDENGRDRRENVAKFLDVLDRVRYLRDLGVTAVQFLPIQEYPYDNSLGYNGVDYFSPEMAYQVEDALELARYRDKLNALLAEHNQAPVSLAQLWPGPNQLKAVVDALHLNGIAVIFDVVYNHAGGEFGDQSLYFMDRRVFRSNADSLYFTNDGWAGGLVFDYSQDGVRDFLIRNARFFLDEYHVDGLRYDEVTVIDEHGGWQFCQELTDSLNGAHPERLQIAEYWNDPGWRWLAVAGTRTGMGFDAALGDGLRDSLRDLIDEANGGQGARVNVDRVRDRLYRPHGFQDAWRVVTCLENHDVVYADRKPHEWKPRLAWLCDPSDSRSWHGRSRNRFATGLLMTAPGIPMLFMGQEILEDKNWSDNPRFFKNSLIWWDGLQHDRAMRDHLKFCQDLVALRRREPALRGESLNVFHVWNDTRVIAYHRWIEQGRDVVVVGSLNESTWWQYQIGFPRRGRWREIFNSDVYDHFPNPWAAGNGGAIEASGPPMHGFEQSAAITIPANGIVVFAAE